MNTYQSNQTLFNLLISLLVGFILGRYIVPAMQRYHDNWVKRQRVEVKPQPWITGSLESRFIKTVEEHLNSLYLKTNSISCHQLQEFNLWFEKYAKTQSYHDVKIHWAGNNEGYKIKFSSAERCYEINGVWKLQIDARPFQVALS